MTSPSPVGRLVVSVVLAAMAVAAGCGDDDPVTAQRTGQLRDAATDAGLDDDVADLLGLAAGASGNTFQVTYPGDDGGVLVVTQRPPDRRVDLVDRDEVLESHVVRGTVAYRCGPDDDGRPACVRDAGAVRAPGSFTERALADLVDALDEARSTYDLGVEDRTVAGTAARCLVTTLRPGGDAPDRAPVGTLCLSAEGAQLLIDTAGTRLEATAYTTDVDADAFDLPAPDAPG